LLNALQTQVKKDMFGIVRKGVDCLAKKGNRLNKG
jgi:hypothetical protein